MFAKITVIQLVIVLFYLWPWALLSLLLYTNLVPILISFSKSWLSRPDQGVSRIIREYFFRICNLTFLFLNRIYTYTAQVIFFISKITSLVLANINYICAISVGTIFFVLYTHAQLASTIYRCGKSTCLFFTRSFVLQKPFWKKWYHTDGIITHIYIHSNVFAE